MVRLAVTHASKVRISGRLLPRSVVTSFLLQDTGPNWGAAVPFGIGCYTMKHGKCLTKGFFQRIVRREDMEPLLEQRSIRDPVYTKDALFAEEPHWVAIRGTTPNELPLYHPYFITRGKKDGENFCRYSENIHLLQRLILCRRRKVDVDTF